MKVLKLSYLFFLIGLFVISCQKESDEPLQELKSPAQEFDVPVIPDEIASLMSTEDLARFKAGPGEEYLQRSALNNARLSCGRWYPVLMKLGYHLQFVPIGGTSCQPGEFVPCFGPGAPSDPTECLNSIVGSAGMTYANGNWFTKTVHSEYYPVLCGEDYAGYGQGFYRLQNGLLWLEGENGPFHYDDEGNATFFREANYIGDQSTGSFEGAFGWEVTISYTAVENNPKYSADGTGYSDVITFGWVHLSK